MANFINRISTLITKKFWKIHFPIVLHDILFDYYAILFRSGKFEEYLETLFRIWTFALRWKRKNYNKIILAFISDYIYWKENQHPFANVLENHLVNFNEYYVENFHSRLRANIIVVCKIVDFLLICVTKFYFYRR